MKIYSVSRKELDINGLNNINTFDDLKTLNQGLICVLEEDYSEYYNRISRDLEKTNYVYSREVNEDKVLFIDNSASLERLTLQGLTTEFGWEKICGQYEAIYINTNETPGFDKASLMPFVIDLHPHDYVVQILSKKDVGKLMSDVEKKDPSDKTILKELNYEALFNESVKSRDKLDEENKKLDKIMEHLTENDKKVSANDIKHFDERANKLIDGYYHLCRDVKDIAFKYDLSVQDEMLEKRYDKNHNYVNIETLRHFQKSEDMNAFYVFTQKRYRDTIHKVEEFYRGHYKDSIKEFLGGYQRVVSSFSSIKEGAERKFSSLIGKEQVAQEALAFNIEHSDYVLSDNEKAHVHAYSGSINHDSDEEVTKSGYRTTYGELEMYKAYSEIPDRIYQLRGDIISGKVKRDAVSDDDRRLLNKLNQIYIQDTSRVDESQQEYLTEFQGMDECWAHKEITKDGTVIVVFRNSVAHDYYERLKKFGNNPNLVSLPKDNFVEYTFGIDLNNQFYSLSKTDVKYGMKISDCKLVGEIYIEREESLLKVNLSRSINIRDRSISMRADGSLYENLYRTTNIVNNACNEIIFNLGDFGTGIEVTRNSFGVDARGDVASFHIKAKDEDNQSIEFNTKFLEAEANTKWGPDNIIPTASVETEQFDLDFKYKTGEAEVKVNVDVGKKNYLNPSKSRLVDAGVSVGYDKGIKPVIEGKINDNGIEVDARLKDSYNLANYDGNSISNKEIDWPSKKTNVNNDFINGLYSCYDFLDKTREFAYNLQEKNDR